MKVDAMTLDLRPRSMNEASDLGVRLAATHARDLWRTVGPVYAVVVLVALSTVSLASWLPMLTLFWLKPWLDRSVLFVLSRAVFGHETRFADLWAAQRDTWWSQGLPTLTLRRLSPWRAYVLPAQQLEGQTGAAQRKRIKQLLNGRQGAAFGVQAAFSWLESAISLGTMVFVLWWFSSGESIGWWSSLMQSDKPLQTVVQTLCYALAIGLVEPFFVGAGFAMYLNRRVELEAWDVEQEFRLAFAR